MTGARTYHYDECGLDNVLLEGLPVCTDDLGDEVVTIDNINDLHRVIVRGVASQPTGLQPKELRFVRTELGLTQAELAAVVGKDAQTVGRWERGETPIEPAAETVVRVLALQHVSGGDPCALPPVEDLARRAVMSSGRPPLRIDASNPKNYHALPEREAA